VTVVWEYIRPKLSYLLRWVLPYLDRFDLPNLLNTIIHPIFATIGTFCYLHRQDPVCTPPTSVESTPRPKEPSNQILKNKPFIIRPLLQIFDEICKLYHLLLRTVYVICLVTACHHTQLESPGLTLFWLIQAIYSCTLSTVKLLRGGYTK